MNLGAYDDGQKVTVGGALVPGGGAGPVLEASRVEEAQGAANPGEGAVLAFELGVEGEPPKDATFFGNIQTGEGGPGILVPLDDPDGDGTYTGSTTINSRFAPGLRPLPPDAEPLEFPVRIVQGSGMRGELPGEPVSVLKDFGTVPMQEENTFPASLSFGGFEGDTSLGGGTTMGETTGPAVKQQFEDGGGSAEAAGIDLNEDGVVDEADGEFAARTSEAADAATGPDDAVLPDTGGAPLPSVALAAGLLLAARGLLRVSLTR